MTHEEKQNKPTLSDGLKKLQRCAYFERDAALAVRPRNVDDRSFIHQDFPMALCKLSMLVNPNLTGWNRLVW
jgi:hypothetical protein